MRQKELFSTRLLKVLPIVIAFAFYFGACKSGEKPAIKHEHGHLHTESDGHEHHEGDGHDHNTHKDHDHGDDFDHGHTHDSTGHDSLEKSR